MSAPIPSPYRTGELRVPLFAACQDMRQIIRPDDTVLGVVIDRDALAIVEELNKLLYLYNSSVLSARRYSE